MDPLIDPIVPGSNVLEVFTSWTQQPRLPLAQMAARVYAAANASITARRHRVPDALEERVRGEVCVAGPDSRTAQCGLSQRSSPI